MATTHADLIVSASWLIPIEPRTSVIENGALVISGNKIIAVGPAAELNQAFSARQRLDKPGHVLMPGLINAHTHSPMSLLRGFADDYQLMDWLKNYIWPVEKALMGPEFIYDGTQLAICEMLKSGSTCFNENYFYSEVIAQATHDSQMRAVIGQTLIDFATNNANSLEAYLDHTQAAFEQWHKHPLIDISLSPHAPYSVSDTSFSAIKKMAEKYDMLIHLHLQETFQEVEDSIAQYGMRPLERLAKLGITEHHLQCVHMVAVNQQDIEFLQNIDAHILHCPESNMKLASGFAPIASFLQHGINVAIGTDGAASNNDLDMFAEMRVAAQLAKAVAKNPTALNVEQTLYAATMGGARALGLQDKIGSLKAGKEADFILIDMSDCNTQPLYQPLSQLVYATNCRQVSDVFVAGRQLVKDGQLTQIDEACVKQKAKAWQKRIWQYYPDHKKAVS